MLAYAYYEGTVTERNLEESTRWMRKAAEAGNLKAQKGLGDAYRNGIGVEIDLREAQRWFHIACNRACIA